VSGNASGATSLEPAGLSSAPARLTLLRLNKQFGDTKVLHDVNLSVLRGEIHGLAGQNGSGKSTVIKVLTGVYAPDAGTDLDLDGRPVRLPVRWGEVHRAGVSVVHQDLGLLDELTVADNICVGGFPRGRWLGNIDRRRRDELSSRSLLRVGATFSPSTVTADLNAAERAEVAIARALRDHMSGEGLIILDEATRALSGEELSRIHRLLKRLAAEGSSVLMISHNLVELSTVADRVSVLRDGRVVADGLPTSETGPEEIARYMLGGDNKVSAAVPIGRSGQLVSETPARVVRLRNEHVQEISFTVSPGEILGITGLPGSGYEEIPYLLTGARSAIEGVLDVGGVRLDLTKCRPVDCIRAGVVLIPERRDRDGLAFEMGVRDNLCVPALRNHGRGWFLGRGWQQAAFVRATEMLNIKTAGPLSLVRELSGGNQQKVLLAKWLGVGPRVVVLHEPTQAVDVGARQDILGMLRSVAADGVSVIFVSSEAEDLVALCDRTMIYEPSVGLTEAQGQTPEELIGEIYSSDMEREGGDR
jgi:ribose transport system ATP-binding protein